MVPEGENGADFCGKDADFQLTGSVAGTVAQRRALRLARKPNLVIPPPQKVKNIVPVRFG